MLIPIRQWFSRLQRFVVVVLASVCLLSANPATAGNLILNGDFESPSASESGNIIEVYPGSELPGFDWKVTSGTVEITQQYYVDPALQVFAGSAYSGSQWLDLDGISAGTITQSFATTPGTLYALSFAYANNPFVNTPADSGDPSATVKLLDTATSDQLASLFISHETSTASDYKWALSPPLIFLATGTNSTLVFASNDAAGSDEGIFLDAVAVTAVPEPSSLSMLIVGALVALGSRKKSACWTCPRLR